MGNNDDRITRTYAWFVDLVWPIYMGGCQLDVQLDRILLGKGGRNERDLHTNGEFKGYEVFRYVEGVCRKAS